MARFLKVISFLATLICFLLTFVRVFTFPIFLVPRRMLSVRSLQLFLGPFSTMTSTMTSRLLFTLTSSFSLFLTMENRRKPRKPRKPRNGTRVVLRPISGKVL